MVLEQEQGEEFGIGHDRISRRLLEFLDAEDRELMALWAAGTVSHRAMGRVLGVHPCTVARRIRRLRKRLADPTAREVLLCERLLPRRYRDVAFRVICRGEPIARVARSLGMTVREVRLLAAEVRGWARAHVTKES